MTNPSIRSSANNLETSPEVVGIPLWVSLVVILGIVLSIGGAVIAKVDPTLITSKDLITDTVRVYSDYVFARNLSLALMLLFLLAVRARRMLAGFMALTALIQLIDVANDLARGSFQLVPGLLVFAVVFLLGAWKLFGQPIWQVSAWRDQ